MEEWNNLGKRGACLCLCLRLAPRFLLQLRLHLLPSLFPFSLLQITTNQTINPKPDKAKPHSRYPDPQHPNKDTHLRHPSKMHNSCPKCSAAVSGGSKTCSSCGSVGYLNLLRLLSRGVVV